MNAPHERTGALEAALEYGKRGWPVFQTFIQGEKLLPASAAKDGGPRWDATTDPEEIKRRWTINPNAGVGIATGRTAGILVIDIDTMKGHGEDGYASLAELESSNGLIPFLMPCLRPLINLRLLHILASTLHDGPRGQFILTSPCARDTTAFSTGDFFGSVGLCVIH